MKRHPLLNAFVVCLATAITTQAAEEASGPIPGIGPTGPPVLIADGMKFTEGPAADADGTLYFTDVPANLVYRAVPDGEPEVVLEDSQGTNGLMFDRDGRLIGCQGGAGRIITIDPTSGAIEVLSPGYNDNPYNRPNDLVVDRQGGIYFSDPSIGRGRQDKAAVYYLSTSGEATRLADDIIFPNGVLLSPDEKTLYVLSYVTAELTAYAIDAPGEVGDGRLFCRLDDTPDGKRPGGDGLAADVNGNLYLTAPRNQAIQVFDKDGQSLGRIDVPKPPSNCCFGGPDGKTLYVTAVSDVYAVPMEVAGHRLVASTQ